MRDFCFGNFLRGARERRGLSQYQLGMLVGVSDKAVSKWENGSAKPRSHILYRLGEALGITVDELLACRYRLAENGFGKGVREMERVLWDKVYEAIEFRYGKIIPFELGDRYYSEYEELKNTGAIRYFELLGRMGKMAESTGGHMYVNGGLGASLAAYVLGASGVNPLKPHYYCPDCHKIRFVEGAVCGWDLPKEKCSCGRECLGDGHNLPFEMLRAALCRPARYDVFLSRDLYGAAQDMLMAYFREDVVVPLEKEDNSGIRSFVILDGRTASSMYPEIAELAGEGSLLSFEEYYVRLKQYPMITLIRNGELDKYRHLEKLAGIPFTKVPFTDKKVLEAFAAPVSGEKVLREGGMREWDSFHDATVCIPEFDSDYVRDIIRESSPSSFHDLIQIPGLAHSTGAWEGNGRRLVGEGVPIGEIIAYRDDVFLYIRKKAGNKCGAGTGYAYRIMEDVRRGVYARGGMPEGIRRGLAELGAEDWFTESIGKICYVFPRAQSVLRVKYALILMWYKINCPEAFARCGLTPAAHTEG